MDHACVGSPALGGDLGSWADVKAILVDVALSTSNGFKEFLRKRNAVLDLIYDAGLQVQCPLGHQAVRLDNN